MQTLLKTAKNIELKVKQLKSRLEMLEKENAFYKEENKNLVEKLKQQKGLLDQHANRKKELEIQANHKVPGEKERLDSAVKAELIEKIDGHVKDIDQVIDVLRSN